MTNFVTQGFTFNQVTYACWTFSNLGLGPGAVSGDVAFAVLQTSPRGRMDHQNDPWIRWWYDEISATERVNWLAIYRKAKNR